MKLSFDHLPEVLEIKEDLNLLEQLIAAGYRAPKACKNGVCHICEAKLIKGKVRTKNESKDNGIFYPCISYPESDCHIEMPAVRKPGDIPLKRLSCQIESVQALNHDVFQVNLLAPAGNELEFMAGQYLEMHIDGEGIPFSIANAPNGRLIELHIRVFENSSTANRVMEYLNLNSSVEVTLPLGDVHVSEAPNVEKLVMVASSTGFSQIKSILEQIFKQDSYPEIHLYWANQFPSDFYLAEQPEEWVRNKKNFVYHPILSGNCDSWEGRTGLIYHAIEEDFRHFDNTEMYICGSPNTVYDTLDNLENSGLTQEKMHSDVFSYAPRN